MSEKEEKLKQPLKDVTGKELDEKALNDVSGGKMPGGGLPKTKGATGCTCASGGTASYSPIDT